MNTTTSQMSDKLSVETKTLIKYAESTAESAKVINSINADTSIAKSSTTIAKKAARIAAKAIKQEMISMVEN